MNAADTMLFRMINEARKERAEKAALERMTDCPLANGCDGSCLDCEHAFISTYVEREFEHVEYTSVCPTCGKGYQSEHGQDWTCRACRQEHELGELRFWE